MLREIGFDYASRIDPFDGGPHFHARTDDITLVRHLGRARVAAGPPPAGAPLRPLLVGRERTGAPPYLRAARALCPESAPGAGKDGTLALPPDVARLLEVAPGDEVAFLPLGSASAQTT